MKKNTAAGKLAKTLLAAGIIALLGGAQALSAQDEFEFHGYIRSGAALNADLINAVNGVDSRLVGRLGNERDSWIETELVKKFTSDEGVWTKMHANLVASGSNMALTNSSGGFNFAAYFSQAYVEMGGFSFDPKATFRIGQMPNFEDVHIQDLKWRNIGGAGIGVSGALDGALGVALLTSDITSPSIPFTLDIRYNLAPTLQVEVAGAYAKDASKVTNDSSMAAYGFEGAVVYYWDRFYGLPIGWMTIAAQAGTGMFGASLGNKSSWSALGQLGNIWTQQDSLAFRLLTSGTGSVDDFDLAAGVWAEYDISQQKTWSSSAGANIAADPKLTLAATLRPAWKADKNFSLVGEAGLAYQAGGGYYWDSASSTSYKRSGLSYKVTLAPTLALDSSVGARPQLRAFATYEGQDAKLGMISADGKSGQELKFGIQAEVWW